MEDPYACSPRSVDGSLAGNRLRIHLAMPLRNGVEGLAGTVGSTTCDFCPHGHLAGAGLGEGAGAAVVAARAAMRCLELPGAACGKLAQGR